MERGGSKSSKKGETEKMQRTERGTSRLGQCNTKAETRKMHFSPVDVVVRDDLGSLPSLCFACTSSNDHKNTLGKRDFLQLVSSKIPRRIF